MEQVPESSRQTSNFGRNQYIGTYILSQSALPRIVSPIQPRRAQYSPLQHSSAQYSPVQLSTAQYSLLQPTTAQYSAVQPSTAQCSPVHHGNPYQALTSTRYLTRPELFLLSEPDPDYFQVNIIVKTFRIGSNQTFLG